MLFFGLVGLVNLVAGAPVVAAAAAVAAARGHSAFPPRRLLAIALAKGLADNLLCRNADKRRLFSDAYDYNSR